jgi:hypothetical protein
VRLKADTPREGAQVVDMVIKPLTEQHGCCRFLELPFVAEATGPATVFVVHSWWGNWGALVAAAAQHSPPDRLVWVDVLALRQVGFRGDAESSLGGAKSSLGDAKSSLGDAESSLGDAESSLGDAKSSLGAAKSSMGAAKSSMGDVKSSLGDAESSLGDAKSSLGDAKSSMGDARNSLGDAESSLGG